MSGTVAGSMGAAPTTAGAAAPDPVLFDDIDPILLAKVYPGATDAKADAMAAGTAAKAEGEKLEASQQQPQGDAPTPPAGTVSGGAAS